MTTPVDPTPASTPDAKPFRASRRGLIIPFVLAGLLLAVWTGWWFVLARQVETRLEAQAQVMRDGGWTVQWARAQTTGWPFRTRVALTDVRMIAPSGQGIAAPELVAEANAYNPDRWVIVATDGLEMARADKGRVAVRGEALRMSVSHLRRAVPEVRVDLSQPVFTPLPGSQPFPIASADRILFNSRPHMDGDAVAPGDRMDIKLMLTEARGRAGGPVEGATQQGQLSADIEAVVEKASALRGPNAQGMFAAWSLAGGALTQVNGRVSAGQSRAVLSSDSLRAGPEGLLEGTVRMRADKALPMLAGMARTQSGSINQMGAAGAAAASAVTGGGGRTDIVLEFRNGRTWLGPFALAPAPRLF